jgi:hypothetical protein
MFASIMYDSLMGRLVPETVYNTQMTPWLDREKGSKLKML